MVAAKRNITNYYNKIKSKVTPFFPVLAEKNGSGMADSKRHHQQLAYREH